jgi:hypothetical protein
MARPAEQEAFAADPAAFGLPDAPRVDRKRPGIRRGRIGPCRRRRKERAGQRIADWPGDLNSGSAPLIFERYGLLGEAAG